MIFWAWSAVRFMHRGRATGFMAASNPSWAQLVIQGPQLLREAGAPSPPPLLSPALPSPAGSAKEPPSTTAMAGKRSVRASARSSAATATIAPVLWPVNITVTVTVALT